MFKDIEHLKITIECGKVKHSSIILDKEEFRVLMKDWRFFTFMKRYNERIEAVSQRFIAEFIKYHEQS